MTTTYFKDEQNRIIRCKDGEMLHLGEPFKPESSLTFIGERLSCETLGYEIGQMFKTLKSSGFYGMGSILKLHTDDGSSAPLFEYVSGTKTSCNEVYVSLENIVPISTEEAQKLEREADVKLATKRLKEALSLVDSRAVTLLPEDLFLNMPSGANLEDADVSAVLLDWAFTWSNTPQGHAFWKSAQNKLKKAEADREKLVELLQKVGRKDAAERLPEFISPFDKLEDAMGSFSWGEQPGFWRETSGHVSCFLKNVRYLRERVQAALDERNIKVELPEFNLSARGVAECDGKTPAKILESAFSWYAHGGAGIWRDVCDKLEKPVIKKIEMGRAYKTKNGAEVRIVCIDRPDDTFPVIGVGKSGAIMTFTEHGRYRERIETDDDLVEVAEETRFKKDEKVEVSEDGQTWHVRHYAKYVRYDKHTIAHCAFNNGETSKTSTDFSYWKHIRKI